MSRKDKFKVYSNTNMPKGKQEEEIEVSLELPEEDALAGLFLTSPYFMDMILKEEYFYYPVDLEAEETMIAPLMNIDILRDFLKKAEAFCKSSGIPLVALLHVEGGEEDEQDMVPLVEGKLQVELLKFFRTSVAVMNPELALDEDFDEVFDQLLEEVGESGYLDTALASVMDFMSDPDFLEGVLFPEEE